MLPQIRCTGERRHAQKFEAVRRDQFLELPGALLPAIE